LLPDSKTIHPTAKVSKEVNRKCPAIGTRQCNIQHPTLSLSATMQSVTDGQTTL